MSYIAGSLRERVKLEYPDRSVPDDGLRCKNGFLVNGPGLGTNIHTHLAVGNVERINIGNRCVGSKAVAAHMVYRKDNLDILCRSGGKKAFCGIDKVVFNEGFSHGVPLGLEEGVGHTAADDEGGGVLEQAFEHRDLRGNLRAADDGGHGLGRIGNHGFEICNLFFHEEAADLDLHELRDGRGRGMGTVRGSERVIYIDIAVRGKFFRKHFLFGEVFGCFFLVETGIFEHEDAAFGKRVNSGFLSDAGIGKGNRKTELAGKILGNGFHAVLAGDERVHVKRLAVFFRFLFGLLGVLGGIAEMAHEHD